MSAKTTTMLSRWAPQCSTRASVIAVGGGALLLDGATLEQLHGDVGHTLSFRSRCGAPAVRRRSPRPAGRPESYSTAPAAAGRRSGAASGGGHAGRVTVTAVPRPGALVARTSPVRPHDPVADGQAEAGAAVRPGAGRIGAVEALEDVGQVLGRDAGAGVRDPQHRPRRRPGGLDGDPAPGGGELEAVVHQVHQELRQAGLVAGHDRRAVPGLRRRRPEGGVAGGREVGGPKVRATPRARARGAIAVDGIAGELVEAQRLRSRASWPASARARVSSSLDQPTHGAPCPPATGGQTWRGTPPAGAAAPGHVEPAGEHGQRRTQLVGGVGGEAPLAPEGLPGAPACASKVAARRPTSSSRPPAG